MRYYLDTEFDGARGPLVSLALVAENGHSLYCVTEHDPTNEWVRANVCPVVLAPGCPSAILCPPGIVGAATAHFLRPDAQPVIVADWLADIEHLCRELAARSLYWEDPDGDLQAMPPMRFEVSNVDAYPTTLAGAVQHNAWWDAMALREKLSREAASPADRPDPPRETSKSNGKPEGGK